jgi:hypothetical protein
MPRPPTLWTTLRDFSTVVIACIVGAVALFSLINKVHAESLPPPAFDAYGPGPGPRAAWVACEPDVRRYCPNVLPGGGRILSCLAGNKDRLTFGCRDTLIRIWAYRR